MVLTAARRRAARQRDGHAPLSGTLSRRESARPRTQSACRSVKRKTLTKFPCCDVLRRPVAPDAWRARSPSPITSDRARQSPHAREVQLDTKRLYDVIVRIPGSSTLTNGSSGQSSRRLVNGAEIPFPRGRRDGRDARPFRTLKQGWKPKRTIIYCSGRAKNPDCSAPRSGGDSCRGSGKTRRRLYQHGWQWRDFKCGGFAHP